MISLLTVSTIVDSDIKKNCLFSGSNLNV